MRSENEDLVGLFDAAWTRFTDRMQGLSDIEWAWCPTPDRRIGLRWRLAHLRTLLTEERNWVWLGAIPPRSTLPYVDSAEAALASLREAFLDWRNLLVDSNLDLATVIGQPAGAYRQATRRSFVLHVADELIHHSAEAALLRDLFAHKPR